MAVVGEANRVVRASVGRLLLYGVLAGVVTAVVNAVLYLVAAAFGAMSADVVVSGGGPVTLGAVISSSFVPAVLGAVVLAVLGRFTLRSVGIFRVVALVLLVLSFVTPFSLVGAPVAMILVLLLMHVVVAGVTVWVLTTLAPKRG